MSDIKSSPTLIDRRINGLQFPFHPFQIATWILYPFILLHYFAFLLQIMWNKLIVKVVVTIVFGILAILSLYYGYLTCKTDPADDSITKNLEIQTVNTTRSKPDGTITCHICKTPVHESSKHCRFCNKCVVGFDHHCKWLNTCVGKKNYNYFLGTVASVTLLTTTSLTLCIALLVEAYAYPTRFTHYYDGRKDGGNGDSILLPIDGVRGILLGSVAIYLPLVIMIYQLAGFHLNLLYHGMTTYDFIISENKRLRDRDAARLQRNREKAQARAKRKEGNPTSPPTLIKDDVSPKYANISNASSLEMVEERGDDANI
eukprot:gene13373-17933_t